jgi:succinate-semialdehyde dehydrogenase/glutarate-semialdehyde dehydrogenase
VTARHRNCGQVCIAPQRFYVHADIFERFVEAMAAAIRAEVVGPGGDPRTTVGPLINERQRAGVHDIVTRSIAAGAVPVVGGRAIAGRGSSTRRRCCATCRPTRRSCTRRCSGR